MSALAERSRGDSVKPGSFIWAAMKTDARVLKRKTQG